MSASPLLLKNLAFSYPEGSWALSIPSLCLGNERMTAIVGPNGSGKSTLLRIAAGVLTPQSGQVEYGTTPLVAFERGQLARRLGFLPQFSPSLFDLSVEEVVAMGRYPHRSGLGFLSEADRHSIQSALDAVGLESLSHRPISQLSGGERRRAFIASLLAQQPDLMLLDEPTSALDVHHASALMRQLTDRGDSGPSVVWVTHDLNLAAMYSHRILLIDRGCIQADGSPDEVLSSQALRDAYANELYLLRHPETGGPVVLPRRTSSTGEPHA